MLDRTSLTGQLKADFGILEIDENVIPLVLPQLQPKYIMALNLFRDQLDRYGEVDTITYKWGKIIAGLPSSTTLIINGDDPALTYLGHQMAAGAAGLRHHRCLRFRHCFHPGAGQRQWPLRIPSPGRLSPEPAAVV